MEPHDWSWAEKHKFTGEEMLDAEIEWHKYQRAQEHFKRSPTYKWLREQEDSRSYFKEKLDD